MLKKTHRLRLLLLAVMSLGAFGVIIWRLYAIQIEQHVQFKTRAEHQHNKKIQLIPRRGDILDRNGLTLATSFVSNTIYIDTRTFRRAEQQYGGPGGENAAEDEASTRTAATPDLVGSIRERLERQKEQEAAKDRARAVARWERRNRHKKKAWDELGVDPQLVEDLAEAICTPPDPETGLENTTQGLVSGARSLPLEAAREMVREMFEKPRRHLFYRKAPESLTEKLLAIETRYALPDGFVVYEKHSKRFYPNGSLASHLLGFTSIDESGDNVGISGIEQQYNDQLKGRYATQSIQINSGQRGLTPLDDGVIASTYGNSVVLTIDQQLQMHAERALRTQVGRYQARGGIALVMDVHTGGILAMASCPDFDPNHFREADQALQLKNRILTDPIEIGSVMKIITATLLLDKGLLRTDEMIDCSSPKVFGTRVVRDVHSLGAVPFHQAFAESSNVGLVTVGLRLEPSIYYEGLVRFGLGQPTQVDLPGEGNGVLHTLDKWSALSRTSLPMGYETSLTPLQVICALSAIANDGMRPRPHLIREIRSPRGDVIESVNGRTAERVAAAETCAIIRGLMESVVLEGTGKAALIPGYRVGGKTGTTVKYNTRTDDDSKRRYYSSFAGLLPIDNPRVAIYTYVDEPQGAKYGGTVAAPIFREIALAAAHALAIPPNDPVAYAAAKLDQADAWDALGATSHGLETSATLQTEMLAQADPVELAPGDDGPALPNLPLPVADNQTTAAWAAVLASDPKARPAPDLRGLTMTAAYAQLAATGLEGELSGSGLAVSQQPPPGAPIRRGERLRAQFMLASGRPLSAEHKNAGARQAGQQTGIDAAVGRMERATLQPMGAGANRWRVREGSAESAGGKSARASQ